MTENRKYCPSIVRYIRRNARIVDVGGVPLGGDYPVRIQSMTISDTMNTAESVDECIRIIEAGADYVRLTAPSIREAENLKNIKKELRERGYNTPLIADIHYTPNAAIAAARIVEKVRVNPGNYADRKRFENIDYSDESYNAELERIYERFSPLVKLCKQEGTAMRVGTNHGSLSDRIMSRYGDTPLGMVESAMEFLRICEDLGYYNVVLSMKASNPIIMVQAYRLLVNRMDDENMKYPLHLGVTEAGEGDDGRIKSALGIGTLLDDGLGDTIRVSLTEPPEDEIPVAKELLKRYISFPVQKEEIEEPHNIIDPFNYSRRKTTFVENIGGKEAPRVIADCSNNRIDTSRITELGYTYNESVDKWNISDTAADYIYAGKNILKIELPPSLPVIYDFSVWKGLAERETAFPLFYYKEYFANPDRHGRLNFVVIPLSEFNTDTVKQLSNSVIIIEVGVNQSMAALRPVFFNLIESKSDVPVILKNLHALTERESFQINYTIDVGGLLLDGLGDGIWLSPSDAFSVGTAFSILQATRTRITKTEYISCPSCGRTLFDLQKTSARIRTKTDHLKGVKIGIMGCIVNGPGEMADADYGYVGTSAGKISLYRGKDVVIKNLPEENAVDELINLIKEDGNWLDLIN
ncbi:(E)-4-hydroxy-3-methylbut-2-enyl-diphosphate synthase [candidate division KSB1 bacterium]